MEIAESHGLPLVTMLRRAGRFRRPRSMAIMPQPRDSGKVLEDKWQMWVEAESFKRLSFHVMIYDAQTSMSNIVPPMISYTETSLPFPAPAALWFAKDAETWKCLFLQIPEPDRCLPTLAQCVHDAQPLLENMDCLDFSFATNIILFRTWCLIWNYRQLNSAQKQQSSAQTSSSSLISSASHQELSRLLHNFRLTVSDGQDLQQTTILCQELLLLNLHVSFEELQVFAGKEGRQEARRVYPSLRQWVQSRDSRQAVWHAGQVVRAAEALPQGILRDFYAIGLYHAGLTLWAYGVLSREPLKVQAKLSITTPVNIAPQGSSTVVGDFVFLDGKDTPEAQRFIALHRGIPALQGSVPNQSSDTTMSVGIALTDSKAVMEIVIRVLYQSFPGMGAAAPPLVENLCHLMLDLGGAAEKVMKRC